MFSIQSGNPGATALKGGRPRILPTQNTFPLCHKKNFPYTFQWGDPPQVFQIPTYSRRVAPNPTQNTFPLCRKKTSPYTFCRGDPPPSPLNFNLLKAGRPEPHTKKNTLPLIPGAYVKNQIKFSFPLRELLRFLRQKPCVRGLFRRIS